MEQVAQILELNKLWLAQKLSAKERAKMAWQIRRDGRLKARSMMVDSEEVEMLRARDTAEYGDADGPTFEFLVNECGKAGLKGNAVYEAIIEGSYRTDKGINKRLVNSTAPSFLLCIVIHGSPGACDIFL